MHPILGMGSFDIDNYRMLESFSICKKNLCFKNKCIMLLKIAFYANNAIKNIFMNL